MKRRATHAATRPACALIAAKARGMLLTYLTSPDARARFCAHPATGRAALAQRSIDQGQILHCLLKLDPDKSEAGALLLSTPVTVNPTLVSVCGISRACSDLPLEALEKASERELQIAIPGGRFLDDADLGSSH